MYQNNCIKKGVIVVCGFAVREGLIFLVRVAGDLRKMNYTKIALLTIIDIFFFEKIYDISNIYIKICVTFYINEVKGKKIYIQ